MSGRRRVQRLSSLAPKNPPQAVAVAEHTRVQSEAPQAARLLLALYWPSRGNLPCRKTSAAITEEPDGEQFKELLQELQARNPHENRGALEQGLRDKWRAGITEAQIVDAVEIDLLQPDC